MVHAVAERISRYFENEESDDEDSTDEDHVSSHVLSAVQAQLVCAVSSGNNMWFADTVVEVVENGCEHRIHILSGWIGTVGQSP